MSDGLQSLPDEPSAAIKSIIQKNAVNRAVVSVESAVPKGQNYTGTIYRVTVTGEKDGQELTSSYIVKVASDNESIRADIPLSIVYQREAMYYTELFPIYKQMQDEAGITFEKQFRFAECYHTGKENLNEFLVFEDLKPRGYITLDQKDEVTYEHARCALEAYGKLHALSFALKKREPEKFTHFIKNTSEIVMTKDNKFCHFLKRAYKRSTCLVENTKHREVLESLEDDIIDRMLDTLTQDEFSVLSHSDCWSANMMFKYKKNKPVETCLIDFQVCRYGAPTIDLMYYIFGNTTHKLREEHYEDLLSVYYNAMKNHLKALSYDIEQIYPWTRFKQDLKKSSMFGIFVGLGIAMVMMSEDDFIPDISDFLDADNSPLLKTNVSGAYVESVNGIVEDFFKYGYLS